MVRAACPVFWKHPAYYNKSHDPAEIFIINKNVGDVLTRAKFSVFSFPSLDYQKWTTTADSKQTNNNKKRSVGRVVCTPFHA